VEALVAQGIALRKDGRDLEALPLFRKAFEQQPTPRAFAQLGTCEQAVGLWVAAEAHIHEALKHVQDPWIRKHEIALREALGHVQEKLSSVEFWGTPAGARISIDDEAVATLPMSRPVRVVEGRRAVTIDALGFLAARRSIEVRPGVPLREHVALASAGGPPPAGVAPKAMGADLVDTGPPVKTESVPESATDRIYSRWWFWALVGTVAVAGGASAYLLLRSDSCQSSMGGKCVSF
jgi:hypothetical protein